MEDLVYRLRKRAEIRRSITTRKSVQEGKPDRISDLLEEAAAEIERLKEVERSINRPLITRQGSLVRVNLPSVFGKPTTIPLTKKP